MPALHPIARQTVPEAVADQLMDGIVAGEFAAGGALPSERDLATTLGVSRPTVRTALQRLAQAGLLEIRQGGGTTVNDFRLHAGLDLLPRLLLTTDGVDLAVVRDLMSARSEIGPIIAARAASLHPSSPRSREAELPRQSLDEAAAAVGRAEPGVPRQRAALAFWDALVDRSGSIVHRLLLNGLRAAYEPAMGLLADVMSAEVDRVEDYRTIADAVDAGDPEAAATASARLLDAGRTAFIDLLDALDSQEAQT